MSEDWAEEITERILKRGLLESPLEVHGYRSPDRRGDLLLTGQAGICLILGAADTGKTTLAAALTGRLVQSQAVGIIDADIGQSHIGPPTTVGWVVVNEPKVDFSQVTPGGISFVGDVTPVGHLLQLTAAITQCVQQVSKVTDLIIIDTPGFISGPAASALWWTVQRILKPKLILAVQRDSELSDILAGLQNLGSHIELVKAPPQIPTKSPQARRRYRQDKFKRYFQDPHLYNVSLSNVAIQADRNLRSESLIGRLAALRDEKGIDLAIGIINDRQDDEDIVVIKAPQLDISQVRCLVIGDVSIDIAGE